MFKPFALAAVAATFVITGCQNIQSHTESSSMPSSVQRDAKAMAHITAAQLSDYSWQLVQATDNNNHPIAAINNIKQQVQMQFFAQEQNRISFGVGCNSMGGSYTLKNNVLAVDNVMSTQMMCDPDINTAERLLAESMQGSSQLSYKADTQTTPILTQITAEGHTLVWQGAQTPEARYKQAGETVFWRIDHSEQPCPDGTTKSCLRVKPIEYNQQGIKTAEGDWRLFVGEIEGYTHDKSLDRVVRLKRFSVDPSDVKGRQYVYVLDRVIESSVVEP